MAEHGAEKPKKVKKTKDVASETPAAPVKSEKKRKGSYNQRILIVQRADLFKATEDAAPVMLKKKTKTPKPDATSETKKPAEKTVETLDEDKAAEASKELKSVLKKANGSKGKLETKSKKEPKTKKPKEEAADPIENDEDETSDVDDQTEALLKGFESDGDEEDNEKEGGLKEGQPVPKIPLSKKDKKKLKRDAEIEASEKPGVLYVGRIPHGFYEHEMREYFNQFGTILKLRLSRNPKTGSSRHFAFIQFDSSGVAEIVAKTMDNYLLLGHILKVKIVPDEQVHADLFKGANKRFKKVPWNKIQGRALKEGKSEEVWDVKAAKEEKKRAEKAEKLKSIGYEFKSPKLKSAKGVAKPSLPAEEAKPVDTIPVVEETKISVSTSIVEAPAKSKKKSKNAVEPQVIATEAVIATQISEAPVTESEVPVVDSSKPRKKNKTKKA